MPRNNLSFMPGVAFKSEEVRKCEKARIIGSSAAMQQILDVIGRVAASDAPVLVQGETGVGKELIARRIHETSANGEGPFVAINCAAIPAPLLESELFGHARGAFTDARTEHAGLFVQANHGTLFLDEIGDLPLEIQPKLLRALQERTVRPVGANVELPFDARIVAASNHDLGRRSGRGDFARTSTIGSTWCASASRRCATGKATSSSSRGTSWVSTRRATGSLPSRCRPK